MGEFTGLSQIIFKYQKILNVYLIEFLLGIRIVSSYGFLGPLGSWMGPFRRAAARAVGHAAAGAAASLAGAERPARVRGRAGARAALAGGSDGESWRVLALSKPVR